MFFLFGAVDDLQNEPRMTPCGCGGNIHNDNSGRALGGPAETVENNAIFDRFGAIFDRLGTVFN